MKELNKKLSKKELNEYLKDYGFLWGPETNPYGVEGFMSYGPNGKDLKNKIEEIINRIFKEENFAQIETPLFFPEEVYAETGHIGNFKKELFYLNTSDNKKLVGRPEIASTIHALFKQILRFSGNRYPIRVFQSGPVLPNDRQTEWQIRTRQYTGHEGHIFYQKSGFEEEEIVSSLKKLAIKMMTRIGLPKDGLVFREKSGKQKPFYAKKAYGLYTTLFGKEIELLGIQYRSDYDFQKLQKVKLKELPEVFEISFSTDRPFYVIMANSVTFRSDKTVILNLPDQLKLFDLAVFKTDRSLGVEKTFDLIKNRLGNGGIRIWASDTGSIGQKYKKADALGIPISLSVSEKNIQSNECLLRARDDKTQITLPLDKINSAINNIKTGEIFLHISASDGATSERAQ